MTSWFRTHWRRIATFAVPALFLVQLVRYFRMLTAKHEARDFLDSTVYLETAKQPLAFDHVFYPKPVVTPMLYRWADADPTRIMHLQEVFCVVAWLALGTALWITLRTLRARIAGAFVVSAFLLAPLRVGFSAALLAESVNDSLLALVIAGVLLLARTRRAWLAAPVGIVVVAWLFARDINAITCLAAIAMLPIFVRRWPRWLIALAVGCGLAAVGAIASTRVVPDQPLPLSLTQGWAPEMTTRAAFATVNNIMIRIMPADRSFVLDRGMPWNADCEPFVNQAAYAEFLSLPKFAPTRDWIAAHGTTTYLLWLARHPIARLGEFTSAAWGVLGVHMGEWNYMPWQWRGDAFGGPVIRTVRHATTSRWVLGALLIVFPVLLYRRRRHWLRIPLTILATTAAIGALAAYYGDAIEMQRHCWGASQQLVFGLFIAIAMALDTD